MISEGRAGTLGVLTGNTGVEGRERDAKNLRGFSGLIRCDSNFARPLATAPLGMLIPLMSFSNDLSLFTELPITDLSSLWLEEKIFVTLSITVPRVMPILTFDS